MRLVICNLCATPVLLSSAQMLSQGDHGFERYYCRDPEWGMMCWFRIVELLKANGTWS